MHGDWPGMLRSKGYFWLATRHSIIGMWSQAGGSAEYRPIGYWWAAAPRESWPTDPDTRTAILAEWQEPWGDRRQQLVFIGQEMQREQMLEALATALLTDAEMALGPDQWATTFHDPLPAWTTSDHASTETDATAAEELEREHVH